MPGLDPQIFSLALSLFLLLGTANVMIEMLITLVKHYKKLKATMKSDYSLETGKFTTRLSEEKSANSKLATPDDSFPVPGQEDLEVNAPS